MKGEVRDNVKAGVLEPLVSKVKSFKSALEASTSLLRIDDRVRFLRVCGLLAFASRSMLSLTFARRSLSRLNRGDRMMVMDTRVLFLDRQTKKLVAHPSSVDLKASITMFHQSLRSSRVGREGDS